MKPIVEQVASEMKDTVEVAKIDASDPTNDEMLEIFSITSVPTFVVMSGADELARKSGAMTKDALLELLK